MQPFVSRDLMQFPVAIPGEGLIDVVVQSTVRSFPLPTPEQGGFGYGNSDMHPAPADV
jgi:hypothetical protein